MKRIIFPIAVLILFISCNKNENSGIDFKQEMRKFIIGISEYGKINNPDFLIIPQNGIELVTGNGEEDGLVDTVYLSAINGNGQEDLFYGYDHDDQATSTNDNSYLRTFLDKSKNAGNTILVTDYCSIPFKMDNSYNQNNSAGYVSFAADHRELNNVPNYPKPIYGENNKLITTLSEVKNFLYLINPENYKAIVFAPY